jgi:hypothetical protein
MKIIGSFIALTMIVSMITSCEKRDAAHDSDKALTTDLDNQCVTSQMLKESLASDPAMRQKYEQLEATTAKYIAEKPAGRTAGKLYLPVVIHVVLTDPSTITDAQILSQLDVWNKDFNKNNAELMNSSVYLAGYPLSSVANCEIEFYITQVIRKVTTVQEFPRGSTMKADSAGGSNAVDPTTKLNVWVCNTPGTVSWSHYPGTVIPERDGIVIDYVMFGTNNATFKGRAATHEAGHWLNLAHIWGDALCGDDRVRDTPLHDTASRRCPPEGLRSSCKNKPLKLWMNYMDYSYGSCTYMFTAGQKARMDAAIDGGRKAYFSTIKLHPDVFQP